MNPLFKSITLCVFILFTGAGTLKAQVFNIPDGDVQALITAINEGGQFVQINLAKNGDYKITEVYEQQFGNLAFPALNGENEVIINGDGSRIYRDNGAPQMRAFYVGAANLTLNNLTLEGFLINGYNGGTGGATGGGSGGFGGAIFIESGGVTINSCLFRNNTARGGNGGSASSSGGGGGGAGIFGNGGNGSGGTGGVGGAPNGGVSNGGNGGYGGGGGGGNNSGPGGGDGGFGGGGGAGGYPTAGGIGGFGGGGGAGQNGVAGGTSVFGGGSGGTKSGGGGGGGGAAGVGGAIFIHAGNATIINSTFSGNLAQGGNAGTGVNGGVGQGGGGFGGAVFNLNGTLISYHNTFNSNLAQSGTGGNGAVPSNGGSIFIMSDYVEATAYFDAFNTIIANSNATDFAIGKLGGGTVLASGDGNLIESGGFDFTGNYLEADPKLATTLSTDGKTPYFRFTDGSPALDGGVGFEMIPVIDQRGQNRQIDGNFDSQIRPDIGSYEANPPVFYDGNGYNRNWEINGSPVNLVVSPSINDLDDSYLASATLQIISGFESGDMLNADPRPGITADYDAQSGVLTLTGNAPISDYYTSLSSVSFEHIGESPTTFTRYIQAWISDGSATSDPVTYSVDIIRTVTPPTGVQAITGNQQVTVRWNSVSEPDFKNYQLVFVAEDQEFSFQDSTETGNPSDTTYTLYGLDNDRTYAVIVLTKLIDGSFSALTQESMDAFVPNEFGGRAFAFSGEGVFEEISLSKPITEIPQGTIEFWYRSEYQEGEEGYTILWSGPENSDDGFRLVVGGNPSATISNELIYIHKKEGSLKYEFAYATEDREQLFDGNWHHIAVVFPATDLAPVIYLDGSVRSTLIGDNTLTPWSPGFDGSDISVIGNSKNFQSGYAFLQGELDELRIWEVPRTQTEIVTGMVSPVRGNAVGLISAWHFDESGQEVTETFDEGIAGNNGSFQIYNATTSGALVPPPPKNITIYLNNQGKLEFEWDKLPFGVSQETVVYFSGEGWQVLSSVDSSFDRLTYTEFENGEEFTLRLGSIGAQGIPGPYSEIFIVDTNDPDPLTVKNNNSDGWGSLVAAIDYANNYSSADTIRFDPAHSPFQIELYGSLYFSDTATVLFGDINSDGTPDVELSSIEGSNIFDLDYSRGIVIDGFSINTSGIGIYIIGGERNTLRNNFIGMKPDGNPTANELEYGIYLQGTTKNSILGNRVIHTTNSFVHILGTSNTLLSGNLLGVSMDGKQVVGITPFYGIELVASEFNRIGITGSGNIIGGAENGISFDETNGNVVENNRIGIAQTGENIAGSDFGVRFIPIGGGTPNDSLLNNIISNYNTGVYFGDPSNFANNYQNYLYGNSIFGNTVLGIHLDQTGGVVQNGILPPEVYSIEQDSTVSGSSLPDAEIQIFADNGDQGEFFLGSTVANAYGQWQFKLPSDIPDAANLTAIQTTSGSTSAFSAPFELNIPYAPIPYMAGTAYLTHVELYWGTVTDPGFGFYRIYWGTDSEFFSDSLDIMDQQTSETVISGLITGETYQFGVVAFSSSGVRGSMAETSLTPAYYTVDQSIFNATFYNNARWADFNKDGKMDGIFHGGQGQIIGQGFQTGEKTGENPMATQFSALSVGIQNADALFDQDLDWRPQVGEQVSVFDVSDFNNDGLIDVAAVNEGAGDQEFKIHLNNSNGFDVASYEILPSSRFYNSMRSADMDGDGDYDLIISFVDDNGEFMQPGIWILWNESGSFSSTNSEVINLLVAGEIRITDLDGNERPDVTVWGYDNQTERYSFVIVYNQTWGYSTATLFDDFQGSGQFGDFDQDGDDDFAFSGAVSGVFQTGIYRNNNGSLSDLLGLDSDGLEIDRGLTWSDWDMDGDLDVLVVGPFHNFGEPMNAGVIYINNGGSSFFKEENALGLDQFSTIFPEVFDYDSDGDQDLFGIKSTRFSSGIASVINNQNDPYQAELVNDQPSLPSNLEAFISDSGLVTLSWDASTDTETEANGIRYALKSGTIGFTDQIRSGLYGDTGIPLVANPANIQQTRLTFGPLTPGSYDFTVEAFDQSGRYSGLPAAFQFAVVNYRERDSLALVDLYNSTNGGSWSSKSGWLTLPLDQWEGITVENNRVVILSRFQKNLTGSLPASLANLTKLRTLNLERNAITGMLPDLSPLAGSLTDLQLWQNQFSGAIPLWLGSMVNLVKIDLGRNSFSGEIPDTIYSLVKLEDLQITETGITGSISGKIGQLANLKYFWVLGNNLSGSIPSELFTLPRIRDIRLQNNQFTGNLPATMVDPDSLTGFNFSNNLLTGTIPDGFSWPMLTYFNIANNQLTGSIPLSLLSSPSLKSILADSNYFSIIPDFSESDSLTAYYVESNLLDFAAMGSNSVLSGFRYNPQQVLGAPVDTTVEELTSLIVNSVITGGESYTWNKNDQPFSAGDKLDFPTILRADSGTYSGFATNSSYPDLTLEQSPVTIRVAGGSINIEPTLVQNPEVFVQIESDFVDSMQVFGDIENQTTGYISVSGSFNATLLPGDGKKVLTIRFKTKDGLIVFDRKDSVTFDPSAPVVSEWKINGATETNNTTATMSYSVSGADSMEVFGDISDSFANQKRLLFDNPFNVTLTPPNGKKYIRARFYDLVGNVTEVVDSVILNTNPVSGTIDIDRSLTNSLSVEVYTTVDNGNLMKLTGDINDPDTDFVPYQEIRPVTLKTGDGWKYLTVSFRNTAGTISADFTDSVFVDQTKPVGSISYSTTFPTNEPVTATLSLNEDGVVINNEGSFTYVFTENGSFWFKFADLAGNVDSALATVDNINADAVTGTIAITETLTNIRTLTAALTASNADSVKISGDLDNPTDGYVALVDSYGLTLTTGDGMKKITAQFKNVAGTESASVTDSVRLDQTNPVGTISYEPETETNGTVTATLSLNEDGVVINNEGSFTYVFTENGSFWFKFADLAGNVDSALATVDNINADAVTGTIAITETLTNIRTLTAALTASNADSVKISGDLDNPTDGYVALVDSYGLTLTTGDGMKKITAQYKNVAGTKSASVTDSVRLDQTNPVGTISYEPETETNGTVTATLSLNEDGVVINNEGSFTYVFTENGSFWFKFADLAGNVDSALATVDNINADAVTGTIAITETLTNIRTLTAALTASNADSVKISGDLDNPTDGYVALVDSYGLTLTTGDGMKKITAQYKNVAGTESASVTDSVRLDQTNPVGTISYEPETETNGTVTATLSLNEDGVVINNEGSFTYVFTENGSFWFKFADLAGNVDSALATVDNINADAVTGTIAITETLTNIRTLTAALTASNADSVKISGDLDNPTDGYVALVDSYGLTLTTGDGMKKITAQYKNVAGTESASVTDSVRLDQTNPVGTISYEPETETNGTVTATLSLNEDGVVINNEGSFTYVFTENGSFWFKFADLAGNVDSALATVDNINADAVTGTIAITETLTNIRTLTAALTASNADSVKISGDLDNPTDGYVALVDSYGLTLTTGDGMKKITAQYKNVAGTKSASVTDSVRLDQTNPVGTISYEPETETNGTVTATLSLNEDGVVTNNEGSFTHVFTENGSFWFKFADLAGNVDSALATVDYIDNDAPQVSLLTLAGGVDTTSVPSVQVAMTVTGADSMKFTGDFIDDFKGKWISYSNTLTIQLTTGSGSKTVTAMFKDLNGNETEPIVRSLVLNEPPTRIAQIANQTIAEDSGQKLVARLNSIFSDAITDPGTLSVFNGKESLISVWFEGDSLLIEPVADQNGSTTVIVTRTDSFKSSVSDTFNVSVTPVNDSPVRVAQLPDQAIPEDSPESILASLQGLFTDVDGDQLTLNATSLDPQTLSVRLAGNQVFGTPQLNQTGQARVVVSAIDPSGLSARDTFVVTIEPVNDAPILISPASDMNMMEDGGSANKDIRPVFTDPDGQPLQYEAVSLTTGLSVTLINGVVTVEPSANENGQFFVKVSASDGLASVSDTFMVNVQPVNDAPERIELLADQSIDEDSPESVLGSLTGIFRDVDEDELTPLVTSLDPGKLAVRVSGNQVLVTPALNETGDVDVVVTVSDGGGLSASDTFRVTIEPVNDAPVLLVSTSDFGFDEDFGSQIIADNLNERFSDPEGSSLTFSVTTENSPGQILNAQIEDAVLRVSSVTDQFGQEILYITANDGELSVTDTVHVTINPVNDSPVLLSVFADVEVDEDAVGLTVAEVTGKFSDVEDATLSYVVESSDPSRLTVSLSGSSVVVSAEENWVGSANVIVHATDDDNASVSDTFTVQIRPVNDAPAAFNLLGPDNALLTNGKSVTFSWSASSDADVVYGDTVRYSLQVSVDTTFTNLKINMLTETLFWSPESRLPHGDWFWRVVAVDKSGAEMVSVPRYQSFKADTLAPEFNAYLLKATDNSLGNNLNWAFLTSENLALEPVVSATLRGQPVTGTLYTLDESRDLRVAYFADLDTGLMVVTISGADDVGNEGTVTRQTRLFTLAPGQPGKIADQTLRILIDIPEKAVSRNHLVALSELDGDATLENTPENWILVSKVVGFNNDLSLSKRAAVTFTYQPDASWKDERYVSVYQWDEEASEWKWLVSEGKLGSVSAKISKLGTLAVFYNENRELLPTAFDLAQNYPNPFNPVTNIRFALPVETSVTIRVFNILGQEVATLLNNQLMPPGNHQTVWNGKSNGSQVSSGMYFYRIEAGDFVKTKKMTLLK